MSTATTLDYAYGQDWADSLMACFSSDPFAQEIMARLKLTDEDLKMYYLRKYFYERVQLKFSQQPTEMEDRDPVERVLIAAKAVKEETLAWRGQMQ
jgi:hypothetical protein